MKLNKLTLSVLVALVYAPVQVMAATAPTLGAVFAKTYVTTGDTAKITGNVVSGDVATLGANSTVTGNLTSSGASTLGASAKLGGNLTSGGIATTGASATVGGNVKSGGYVTLGASSIVTGDASGAGGVVYGAGSSSGSQTPFSGSPATFNAGLASAVSTGSSQISSAQSDYQAMGAGNLLAATMTTNTTYAASNGTIFSAASFSTTASTTLTLDDQNSRHDWVFNITDILAAGASSNVVMSNLNAGSTLTWNVFNGYATTGDSSHFLGTVLAKQYITVGANATVAGMNSSCGLYSATSYVTAYANSITGGSGCGMATVNVNPVPEPETYAMLLAGLVSIVFVSRRRKSV